MLERLLDKALGNSQSNAAKEFASGLCQHDPLYERAYGVLMDLAYQQGHSKDALTIYRNLSTRLSIELDIKPCAELQALADQIRNVNNSGSSLKQTTIVQQEMVAATPFISEIEYANNHGVHIAYRQIGRDKPALVIDKDHWIWANATEAFMDAVIGFGCS